MKSVDLLVFCAVTASIISVCSPLRIVVYNNSEEIRSYEDDRAYTSGQSYNIPTVEARGLLVYPNPRNACFIVDKPPSPFPYYVFAFIEDYPACPGENEINLYDAMYSLMITSESKDESELVVYQGLPQAMVSQSFAAYLEEYVLPYSSFNDTTITIGISESYFQLYEKLLLIFGSVLCIAILIALCLFCCSFMSRQGWHKWKNRGLTRWRVRQLPRRKYRGSNEVNETCSICLDDFREGETIRVLPCEHVFHPKCVDEWLQKWNRICPLCKVPISRTRSSSEQTRLLQDNGTESATESIESGRNYGTTTMNTGTGTMAADVDMETLDNTSTSAEEDVHIAVVTTEPSRESPRTTEEQPV